MPRPPRRANGRVIRHGVRADRPDRESRPERSQPRPERRQRRPEPPPFREEVYEDEGDDEDFFVAEEDVDEARDALSSFKTSLMRGVQQVADHHLRQRGIDPSLAKDMVRRGVALSRALKERQENGGPLESAIDEFYSPRDRYERDEEPEFFDDPEEYDEDDFGW